MKIEWGEKWEKGNRGAGVCKEGGQANTRKRGREGSVQYSHSQWEGKADTVFACQSHRQGILEHTYLHSFRDPFALYDIVMACSLH